MNNLNTVLIEGTLTRDPKDETTAEYSQCRLAVANNRYFLGRDGKWKPDPSYFYVYVFGPVADACMQYLKKGRGVRVVGRLKQQSWRAYDGWRERIFIIAEHIEFQPPKKKEDIPEIEPGKKVGFPDTRTDTASMDALEKMAKETEEERRQPEPEVPQNQQEEEHEPVSPTVLDDGAQDKDPEQSSGPENFDEGDAPF